MKWLIRLLLPTALKVIEGYVVKYVDTHFPNEASLAQEVLDFVNSHFLGVPAPSAGLARAAKDFRDFDKVLTP